MLNISEWKILAINSPATDQDKIELPGSDPTSLYYALLPLSFKRRQSNPKIDFNSEIFNPKIWNKKTKAELLSILDNKAPEIVLISNTTPAHPFALEIADIIKTYKKDIVIILWWPHEDETMKNWIISNWATLWEQQKWTISSWVDFVISWDWEYSLLTLVEGIFSNLDNPKEVFFDLVSNWFFNNVDWISTIWTYYNWEIITANTKWNRIDLENIPFLYDYFDNNSYFTVFVNNDWSLKRTAHLMTTRWCIYNCVYCSESTNTFWNRNFYKNHIDFSIWQLLNALNKWSEAAFFEDSVFMWGKWKNIIQFCQELKKLWEKDERVKNFEWGCQMTIENIIRFWTEANEILSNMKETWCSYIFFWIESLAEDVMKNIHKNQIWSDEYRNWLEKVKQVLWLVKSFWFNIWASVLFWLQWENIQTIDYTITWIEELILEWKLDLVSPNIVTYHPWTLLTKLDWIENKIDYNKIQQINEPYNFFEEASPWKTSIRITEEMMYYIKEQTTKRWKSLNQNTTEISKEDKVESFYSDNWWEKLIDEVNYPSEIIWFLEEEKQIIRNILIDWKYKAMLEVGCMQARNFNISHSLNILYWWIDIVWKYIDEAKKTLINNSVNGQVKLLSVNDINSSNTPISLNTRTLALFPFNSFWNLAEIHSAIKNLFELWYDIFISTYLIDDFTDWIRKLYYSNCWYTWFTRHENNDFIWYTSNEGLNSKTYKPIFLKELMSSFWYEVLNIQFWNIWVWYYCKLNKNDLV